MRKSLVLLAMGCAGQIEGTVPFTPDKAFVVEVADVTYVMAAAFGPEGSCSIGDADPDLMREAFTCERFVERLTGGGESEGPPSFGGHSELYATVGPNAQGTLVRCGPGDVPFDFEIHYVDGAVEIAPGVGNAVDVSVDLQAVTRPGGEALAWAKGRFVAERCAP